MRATIPKLVVEPWPAGGLGTLPSAQPDQMVWRDLDGRIIAFGHRDAGEDRLQIPGLAVFRWRDQAELIVAHPEPSIPRSQLIDAFERGVLPLTLQARGLQVLHASAVLTPVGVAAFCGRSEAGKSTLAYACSQRWGAPLWADDAVAFDPCGNVVTAVPLPFSMKLRPASAAHFKTGLRDESSAAHSGMCSATASSRAEELSVLFTLKRIRNLDRPPQAERLTATRAFTEMLEHAYCFDLVDPGRTHATVTHYLELCAKVPVFELRFSPSFGTLPLVLDALEGVLETHAGGRAVSPSGS